MSDCRLSSEQLRAFAEWQNRKPSPVEVQPAVEGEAMEKTLEEKDLEMFHDRVLVRIAKPPTESAGTHGKKIILASGADERSYHEGIVLAVGPGKLLPDGKRAAMSAVVGDTVLWEVFKGQAAGHFDESRWVLKDEEIYCRVKLSPAAAPTVEAGALTEDAEAFTLGPTP